MKQELLKKYVVLEEKFKALEEQKNELRSEILNDLKKNKLEKIESIYGNFTVCKKQTWIYTDAVKKIEEKLKITKSKEQQKGLANSKESSYLLFTENNE